MFVLDTDALSQTTKSPPHAGLMRRLEHTPDEDIYISAVTVHEIQYGIEVAPEGKRRRELANWLERTVIPTFFGRILAVDDRVARESGRLMAATKKAGHTADLGDVLIAATARVHGFGVGTLNRKHYSRLGVQMVDF